eukprot:6171932-Pleurochrysis_carterae.AAC.1
MSKLLSYRAEELPPSVCASQRAHMVFRTMPKAKKELCALIAVLRTASLDLVDVILLYRRISRASGACKRLPSRTLGSSRS